jgi:hypothetical protein
MKLHLLLLASVSLFNLSSGFMAELRGPVTAEECTGDEYAGFQHCAMLGAEVDPSLVVLSEIEEEALVNHRDSRWQLSCSGCLDRAPTDTFCYTFCASDGRRLALEQGVLLDTPPNLRRVMVEDNIAIFENGYYIGGDDARDIAEDIIACLGDVLTHHPCLGTINTMSLIVTVTL